MKNIYIALGIVVFAALLSITGYFLVESNKRLRIEVERLNSNQIVLNDKVNLSISKSGKQTASIQELTYTVKEFKKFQSDDVKTIKDLGLKLKQVESLIKVGIVTTIKDTLVLRDTIILNDTVKCFKKIDEYVKMLGCVRGDSVEIDISHNDTIDNFAHWTYKKWFIFKFKSDTIRLESINKSPYGKITYNKYVKVKK